MVARTRGVPEERGLMLHDCAEYCDRSRRTPSIQVVVRSQPILRPSMDEIVWNPL